MMSTALKEGITTSNSTNIQVRQLEEDLSTNKQELDKMMTQKMIQETTHKKELLQQTKQLQVQSTETIRLRNVLESKEKELKKMMKLNIDIEQQKTKIKKQYEQKDEKTRQRQETAAMQLRKELSKKLSNELSTKIRKELKDVLEKQFKQELITKLNEQEKKLITAFDCRLKEEVNKKTSAAAATTAAATTAAATTAAATKTKTKTKKATDANEAKEFGKKLKNTIKKTWDQANKKHSEDTSRRKKEHDALLVSAVEEMKKEVIAQERVAQEKLTKDLKKSQQLFQNTKKQLQQLQQLQQHQQLQQDQEKEEKKLVKGASKRNTTTLEGSANSTKLDAVVVVDANATSDDSKGFSTVTMVLVCMLIVFMLMTRMFYITNQCRFECQLLGPYAQ